MSVEQKENTKESRFQENYMTNSNTFIPITGKVGTIGKIFMNLDEITTPFRPLPFNTLQWAFSSG